MRPYYDEGGITIYHGDCRELLPELGPIDALLADPPFGFRAYETDRELDPATFFAGVAPRTVALMSYPEILVGWCVKIGRVPGEWITWWPSNATLKAGGRHKDVPRQTECIAVFGGVFADGVREPRADNRPRVNGETGDTVRAGDVWRDPSPGLGFNSAERRHPNEKPLSLMHKLVALCSREGELVVDPTMGSGTTLRAAKDLGRRAIGIDLVEANCETAARRLKQEVLCT
jgi:site-specific DNA-methyltransferase (adenine-specific)